MAELSGEEGDLLGEIETRGGVVDGMQVGDASGAGAEVPLDPSKLFGDGGGA